MFSLTLHGPFRLSEDLVASAEAGARKGLGKYEEPLYSRSNAAANRGQADSGRDCSRSGFEGDARV